MKLPSSSKESNLKKTNDYLKATMKWELIKSDFKNSMDISNKNDLRINHST